MSTSGSRSPAAGPSVAVARARRRSRSARASSPWTTPGRRTIASPSPRSPGGSGTAEGALRQLDDGHDAWVRDVRSLGAAGLARPQGAIAPPEYADAPMARHMLYTHVEVIHHGAEICLLRDLYLWKDSRDCL